MRARRRALVAAVCLIAAVETRAAEITVVGAVPPSRAAVAIATGLNTTGKEIRQAIAVPGTITLALPPGLFEMRLAAAGFWAAPVQLTDRDAVTVKLWPTVPLRGWSNGAKTLRVQFTALDTDGPSGEADCDIDGERWTCNMPAGRYDLRFVSAGSAPEFRFAASVPQSAPMRLQFVPGASLTGRIEPARHVNVAVADAEVFLRPAGGEGSPATQTARANAKGVFQFKGLSPGDYVLHAAAKGLATRSVPVKIVAGLNADLNAPLLLDKPRKFTVTVVPRVDPAGNPWRVQLRSSNKRLRRTEVVSESNVSASGQWVHPRLFAGDYTVEVFSGSGGSWKSEDVSIDSDDVSVVVAALAMPVRGEVALGDRPLKASLSFGGESGVKLESDGDGRFEGQIPADDKDERLILLQSDAPRLKRTIRVKFEREDGGGLHARITLPSTTLMGRVVNADRSPEPHAIITVSRDNPDVFEQTFGESDGSFQIAGFDPGTYKVTADGFQKTSKSQAVELRSDQTAEVELVLERYEHLQGRMTAGDGPVIAAELWALPRDAWGPTVPRATTDESGYFQMDLPPGTTTFDGIAIHPAFDIVIGRAVIQKDKQMHIHAQQIGGTLNVETGSDDALLLLHNGGEFSAGWLAGLVGGSVAPGRLTIPRLQPGQYSVCTAKDKKCASGYLAPHGTLTLTLAAK